MSSSVERMLVGILDKVRGRTNATFKRFHPLNPDLGIYLDHNEVVSFSPPSMRRLAGIRNIIIDQALGDTDPARRLLGHAQKISGSLEHLALKTARGIARGGIHASRSAEVDLLTGYGVIAHLELTRVDLFQLAQAQQHLPKIPVIGAALQAIGRSMARVDLVLPADEKDNILASNRNGNIIRLSAADTIFAGIRGLLLGPSEKSGKEI